MPINFTDFSNIKPITMGNLAEPYMEGRNFANEQKRQLLQQAMMGNELQYQPKRLEAEALQRELANRGLSIGNQSAELDLGYKPRNLQEEYMAKALANRMQQSNITGQDITNKYQPSLYQSKINQAKQAAELSAIKAINERNKPLPLSKSAEKALEKNNERVASAYELRDTVSALDEVMNNPLIESYVGNANQYYPSALMRDSVKQIGGDFETLRGQIGLITASGLKGSISDKDLAFINKQIANRGDTYEVAKAKTETLKATLNQVIRRNELASEYIAAGFPAHKALSLASQQTPLVTAASTRSASAPSKLITIRNSETGEIKKVTQEEAAKLGVK